MQNLRDNVKAKYRQINNSTISITNVSVLKLIKLKIIILERIELKKKNV